MNTHTYPIINMKSVKHSSPCRPESRHHSYQVSTVINFERAIRRPFSYCARAIRRPCLSREETNEDLIRTRAWAWRPAATAFPLQLHALPSRHPPTHRSGFARDRPGLGRVVTCHSAAGMLLLKHPQRPAAGSIPAQADARQGLLHGRALLPSQDLEEVRRASCHCILLP
jgi:hypothetical protein